MPNKPIKIIEKKVFDMKAYRDKKGLNKSKCKPKELSWIPLGEAFQEALSIPGIPKGFTALSRGYTNTGKSTSMYEAFVGAQKLGDHVVFFDTENNFNWSHAKNIGVQFEEIVDPETGELDYDGDFTFIPNRKLVDMYDKFDYNDGKWKEKPLRNVPVIEDIAKYMNEMMNDQETGDFPKRDILFLWDSIGSLNCFRSEISNTNNNMWNAGALESAFKSILNFRIPDTQREDCPYTNTFFAVQKIWFDNMNTVVKHKGGEGFAYGARIILHFGGILTHGTKKINAEITADKVKYKYQFATEAQVKCEKNQVTGIEQMGKICSTAHGYWNPDKLDTYKKEHRDFIVAKLQCDYNSEFETTEEIVQMSAEDMKG